MTSEELLDLWQRTVAREIRRRRGGLPEELVAQASRLRRRVYRRLLLSYDRTVAR